jgi:hypothetical protein
LSDYRLIGVRWPPQRAVEFTDALGLARSDLPASHSAWSLWNSGIGEWTRILKDRVRRRTAGAPGLVRSPP